MKKCEFKNRGRWLNARSAAQVDGGVGLTVTVTRSGKGWIQSNTISVVRTTLNRAIATACLELDLSAWTFGDTAIGFETRPADWNVVPLPSASYWSLAC